MELFALFCVILALGSLTVLTIIDLKYWILPDSLNLALAVLAVCFHVLTQFEILSWQNMLAGSALGGGFLLVVRYFGNRHYQMETLGLGDVKLLFAAGLWLGAEATIFAITLGATLTLVGAIIFASIVALKTKTQVNLKRLTLPAGPGFCLAILVIGAIYYAPFLERVLG
jgi:prepilin signal peptidase PulO-like enzyme (type II secretory pathway)